MSDELPEDFEAEPVIAFLSAALGDDLSYTLIAWRADRDTERVETRVLGNCDTREAATILQNVALEMLAQEVGE